MTKTYAFDLIFGLPKGDHDPYALTDAVFEAGFDDAIVGTGNPALLAVELEVDGPDAETAICRSAQAILRSLPSGASLREVRPDLVSLADVAAKLDIQRQALQQRDMPPPSSGGLYRIDEVLQALEKTGQPEAGRRRPRFDLAQARPWFDAGCAARRVNARLALRQLDPFTLAPLHPRVEGPGLRADSVEA